MIHHLQYISMWDACRNFIFREVHPVIYKREIHGLIPKYKTLNHYIKPSAGSSMAGDGVWATCILNSKCYKYLLLFICFDKTVAFYSCSNNVYLLHIRLDNYYIIVDMLRLIFMISMMMMMIDLLIIMHFIGSRHVILHLTY